MNCTIKIKEIKKKKNKQFYTINGQKKHFPVLKECNNGILVTRLWFTYKKERPQNSGIWSIWPWVISHLLTRKATMIWYFRPYQTIIINAHKKLQFFNFSFVNKHFFRNLKVKANLWPKLKWLWQRGLWIG